MDDSEFDDLPEAIQNLFHHPDSLVLVKEFLALHDFSECSPVSVLHEDVIVGLAFDDVVELDDVIGVKLLHDRNLLVESVFSVLVLLD